MKKSKSSGSKYAHPLELHLKKGALHKTLGVKPGEKIPESMLQKALNSKNPLTRKRAQFAENAKKWNHSK